MFRNSAIAQAFEEMDIEVKEAKDTKEATTYLKELFKDYKDQVPQAFTQDDWFARRDRTKFNLFEKWRKDKNLDFAGCQSSDGEHYRSGKELYSWLPVRIGSKFAYLWSNHGLQRAKCYYGSENFALPVAVW
jgi:nuclear transport factor 2 (NTF2) superfamily protein